MDGAIARRLLAGGLAIGLLADVALDGPALGLNVPLLAAAILALGWSFRRRGTGAGPAGRLAAAGGHRPRRVRRRPWRPVPGVARRGRIRRIHRRIAGRDVRADGHPAIGIGGRDDGGLDARIGRRGRVPGDRSRAAQDGRPAAARPGAGEVGAARAPACRPDRPDLPDPVRLGRPDLRTLAGRHRRLAGGSREPVRAAAVHRVVCVAGRRPAVGGGVGDPGRRAVVARRRRPDRGRPAAGRSARGHRGAGRPGHRRSRRRRLRRAPDRLPVRWARHARGGGHDLQRLRAARILRAGRRRVPGRGGGGRARDDRGAPDAPVPGRAPGPAGVDRGRPRLGGAAPAAVPGCVWLDGAPAVRADDDRHARRHARC